MKPEISQYFVRPIGFIPKPKENKVETVEEYLKRGGKITVIPHGVTAVPMNYQGTKHLRSYK